MFWKKIYKLPITQEDKEWIDNDLAWLRAELGEEHFLGIKTITPTRYFYDRTWDGTEEDAHFILARTMELMDVEGSDVKLEFYTDSPIEMQDGGILSSPADITGKWTSAAGTYEQNEKEKIISIETSQLKNTISLISTIAHEVAHIILLGENRIEENDEFLTDLTAITYGFGIFLGNSRFNYANNNSGWSMNSQGYLPEQIISYAMAWLSYQRNENTAYDKFLSDSMKKYFTKSIEYLNNLEK